MHVHLLTVATTTDTVKHILEQQRRNYSRLLRDVMWQALAIDEPITQDDTSIGAASEDVEQRGRHSWSRRSIMEEALP